jgi:hypothetical protein
MQQMARHLLDEGAMRGAGRQQIGQVERRRAAMILQRFGRHGALAQCAVDPHRTPHGQVPAPQLRRVGGTFYLHDGGSLASRELRPRHGHSVAGLCMRAVKKRC